MPHSEPFTGSPSAVLQAKTTPWPTLRLTAGDADAEGAGATTAAGGAALAGLAVEAGSPATACSAAGPSDGTGAAALATSGTLGPTRKPARRGHATPRTKPIAVITPTRRHRGRSSAGLGIWTVSGPSALWENIELARYHRGPRRGENPARGGSPRGDEGTGRFPRFYGRTTSSRTSVPPWKLCPPDPEGLVGAGREVGLEKRRLARGGRLADLRVELVALLAGPGVPHPGVGLRDAAEGDRERPSVGERVGRRLVEGQRLVVELLEDVVAGEGLLLDVQGHLVQLLVDRRRSGVALHRVNLDELERGDLGGRRSRAAHHGDRGGGSEERSEEPAPPHCGPGSSSIMMTTLDGFPGMAAAAAPPSGIREDCDVVLGLDLVDLDVLRGPGGLGRLHIDARPAHAGHGRAHVGPLVAGAQVESDRGRHAEERQRSGEHGTGHASPRAHVGQAHDSGRIVLALEALDPGHHGVRDAVRPGGLLARRLREQGAERRRTQLLDDPPRLVALRDQLLARSRASPSSSPSASAISSSIVSRGKAHRLAPRLARRARRTSPDGRTRSARA